MHASKVTIYSATNLTHTSSFHAFFSSATLILDRSPTPGKIQVREILTAARRRALMAAEAARRQAAAREAARAALLQRRRQLQRRMQERRQKLLLEEQVGAFGRQKKKEVSKR